MKGGINKLVRNIVAGKEKSTPAKVLGLSINASLEIMQSYL